MEKCIVERISDVNIITPNLKFGIAQSNEVGSLLNSFTERNNHLEEELENKVPLCVSGLHKDMNREEGSLITPVAEDKFALRDSKCNSLASCVFEDDLKQEEILVLREQSGETTSVRYVPKSKDIDTKSTVNTCDIKVENELQESMESLDNTFVRDSSADVEMFTQMTSVNDSNDHISSCESEIFMNNLKDEYLESEKYDTKEGVIKGPCSSSFLPEIEYTSEQRTQEITKEECSFENGSECGSTSFIGDDKMADYKSVTENLFKTCSEVGKILKSVGQDENLECPVPTQNRVSLREPLREKELFYKCGNCSFVDKSLKNLSLHVHTCGVKRKAFNDGEGSSKKHFAPVAIAPKPSPQSSLTGRLSIPSNTQFVISPQTKISSTPKIQIAISSPSTSLHSIVPSAKVNKPFITSSKLKSISNKNSGIVITSQPSVPFSHGKSSFSKTQIPIVPSTPIAISHPPLSLVPSAQLAVTSQGQLTIAQPRAPLLLTTESTQQNPALPRQPTLLGVGIGFNPSVAAKNIVLLPNLILNSPPTSGKLNGKEPNISFQPPIVLRNPTSSNNITTVPLQQSVMFTPSVSASQPQVLLSPVYLTGNSAPDSTSKSSVVSFVQQFPSTISPSITQKISSVTVNATPGGKLTQSETKNYLPKSEKKAAFICEICDDFLKDLGKLRNHMKCLHGIHIHPKAVPSLSCHKCHYCFFTEQGLKRHLVDSHGLASTQKHDESVTKCLPKSPNQATYICEICDDYLKDLDRLRKHMKCLHEINIHPKMMPCFNCQKCQYCFFTEKGLERHLVGSHGLVTANMQDAADKGKDGGRCPICGWGYQNKLLDHIASDHQVSLKPADLLYKCTLCSSSFEVYKLFEKHVYAAHRSDVAKVAKLQGKSVSSTTTIK